MTLYLIAHKVRGELAFDVAEPMEMSDGTWWIIPTSGHRAYPFWTQALTQLDYLDIGDPPAELRDHYTATESLRHPAVRGSFAAPKPEDL